MAAFAPAASPLSPSTLGIHVGRSLATGRGGVRPPMAAHVAAAAAAAAAAGIRLGAFQIFGAGPRHRSITLGDEEIAELSALGAENGYRYLLHNSYMAPPWSGVPPYEEVIREQLRICGRLSSSVDEPAGLVVHLGRSPPAEVTRIMPRLQIETEGVMPLLLLEVAAVRPEHSQYADVAGIRELFRLIREGPDPTLARTGFVLDTAHLWACGTDISDAENMDAIIQGIVEDDAVPPNRLVFHLNDSHNDFGSGSDRHAPLFGGKIWRSHAAAPAAAGAAAVLRYADVHRCAVILERGGGVDMAEDYRRLRPLVSPACRC